MWMENKGGITVGRYKNGNERGKGSNGKSLEGVVYVATVPEIATAFNILMGYTGGGGKHREDGRYGIGFTYSSEDRGRILKSLKAKLPDCDIELDKRKSV